MHEGAEAAPLTQEEYAVKQCQHQEIVQELIFQLIICADLVAPIARFQGYVLQFLISVETGQLCSVVFGEEVISFQLDQISIKHH